MYLDSIVNRLATTTNRCKLINTNIESDHRVSSFNSIDARWYHWSNRSLAYSMIYLPTNEGRLKSSWWKVNWRTRRRRTTTMTITRRHGQKERKDKKNKIHDFNRAFSILFIASSKFCEEKRVHRWERHSTTVLILLFIDDEFYSEDSNEKHVTHCRFSFNWSGTSIFSSLLFFYCHHSTYLALRVIAYVRLLLSFSKFDHSTLLRHEKRFFLSFLSSFFSFFFVRFLQKKN